MEKVLATDSTPNSRAKRMVRRLCCCAKQYISTDKHCELEIKILINRSTLKNDRLKYTVHRPTVYLPSWQIAANPEAPEGSHFQLAEVPAPSAVQVQVSAAFAGLGAKLVKHW